MAEVKQPIIRSATQNTIQSAIQSAIRCTVLFLLTAHSLWLSHAFADIKPDLPTMNLSGRGSYVTSKSGLAESNDTGLMYSYSLNVFAGANKNVSVHLEGNNSNVSYALNNAATNQSELNFLFRLYWGFFYIGAYGGSLQLKVTRADSTILDVFANQYGGTVGSLFNITKGAYLGIEGRVGLPVDLKEATQQDIEMGLKIDGQILMNFDITRHLLDMEAGFLYSTQTATFQGVGTGETISAPFVGLSLNTNF